MADLHLPRLSGSVPYVDERGRATPALQGDWQSAMEALERANAGLGSSVEDIVEAALAAAAAQSTADGKQPASAVLTYLATSVAATAAGVKSLLGLSQVDNVSDLNKPVSTAQQAALDDKADLAGAAFTGLVELTGGVELGAYTVSADAAVVGYITVKDNAGIDRKLAVIA